MAKTKDKVYDAAENVKPYVERAMNDEKLRQDVMSAFSTAKDLYTRADRRHAARSRSPRGSPPTTRSATSCRTAVDDLRNAADRLQGKRSHSGRNTTLLVAGIALGILFNPVTGPETRRWVKDMLGGGEDEFGGDYPSANGGAATGSNPT